MAKSKKSAKGPYRAGEGERAATAGEDGLVGDLVRQFADPYAFHRELVQNAIDAGATNILVRVVIQRVDDAYEARVSVTDDGAGMSQEVLEEDLVVLFRSTKEHADGKIGKFGIGFVSVLALAPKLVEVASATGDGHRHVLHLHPDRTYDLYREQAVSGAKGTTVTLHVPLGDDGDELVSRSRAALTRWCGHARVPIRLLVLRAGEGEPSIDERVDSPLSLDALVAVSVRSEDGKTDAAIGLVVGSRLAAFYNQGLLLHESREKGARASIAFKVADGRLSHTLSREDVRRDAAFDRALALVERGIDEVLTRATVEAIAAAARAHADGDPGAGARWLALLTAAHAAELGLKPSELAVPLLAPVRGARTATLATPGLVLAHAPGGFVDTLAAAGVPVLDRRVAGTAADERTLGALLLALAPSVAEAVDRHTVVRRLAPAEELATDHALLSHVSDLLASVVRRPGALFFAKVEGADRSLALAVSDALPGVVAPSTLEVDPFRLIARPPLALAVDHPITARARSHADVLLAADVLARAILVDRRLLTAERSLTVATMGLSALASAGRR